MKLNETSIETEKLELKDKISKLQTDTYGHIKRLVRMSTEELKHTGHKSIESACIWYVNKTEKEILTLIETFELNHMDWE